MPKPCAGSASPPPRANAQVNIGALYHNGQGVSQDYAEAMRWFRLAADQGDPTAQNNVGYLYATGKGVELNLAEARAWMTRAAAGGEDMAKSWLAHHPE